MAGDLLIRGPRVVDGTGGPSAVADVAVRDGRIAAVGGDATGAAGPGAEVLDGDGLVLAPGFVDIHTHYDAQLMFEPTASPSSWHGVTTVVIGNCGFGLAPSRHGDVPWLLEMLSRVEGMDAASLRAGVDFAGGSFGDYLAHLDGRLGVHVAALVGHCAVRRLVMGDDASTRPATDAEIERMAAVLDEALAQGAVGFSSSQLDVHADHEGRPVPSNVAGPDELVALAAVLRRHPGTVIEFVPRSSLPGFTDEDRDLVRAIARASGGPVNVNMIDSFPGFADEWRRNLAVAEEAVAEGLQVLPMLRANPQDFYFRLDLTFIFDDVPAVRDALTLTGAARRAALADPARRAAQRADLAAVRRSVDFGWDRVTVAESPSQPGAEGRTVAALAAERGVDPWDAVVDLALADGAASADPDALPTLFRIDRSQGPDHAALRRRLAGHPLLVAGASDGGAHLSTFCGADYPTRLLTELVPDPLSLEAAVHKLSGHPAGLLGLADRGVIRPGAVADLVLFDLAAIGVAATRFVADLPAGAARLVHEPTGYRAVIVAGEPILRDGEPTGARPGTVLRPAATGG
jgi:N-acyl-D-aspartate/D-glutamate deacylase